MEWTSLNDLREKYLAFFESKGHLRLPSFPLVPVNDKSLLLINSGMAPMKKYFTGEVTPPSKRVTTCQKCIRTPDIDNVGKTARHGTFFEMLGNFSFGDYFKPDATKWAWEFCTQTLEMPIDKIWISIYQEDNEAFDIWTKDVGVSPNRIVRLGKADNFWEHGTGPCGPCSELHYDRGEKYGCDSDTCGVGCDCDRYVEFWNLVFTQFDSDGKGTYTPLANPNIDTGMGLERLACVSQGVDNLFEVDTMQNIMKHISRIAGVNYKDDEKNDISLRVITDHVRSTTFMISDGVMPSNEGRGYVLRRLLRRAARHGRLLGINRPFLSEVVNTVIKENPIYPELSEKRDLIKMVVSSEEDSFGRTIDQGLQMLSTLVDKLESVKEKILSGEDAFKLNDTYGFPLDLTKDILEEKNITVDEEAFHKLMQEQKVRARSARKVDGAEGWKGADAALENIPVTEFIGFEADDSDSKILAIIKDGETSDFAGAGDNAILVLDKTPFYAESGGQVGDSGEIIGGGFVFAVSNTNKNGNGHFLHSGTVKSGSITKGSAVKASIDALRRLSIRRNHTAAHLLQAALRKVLGTHVEQAGQLVNENSVRFDFTHFSLLTPEELVQVENIINDEILKGIPVDNREMPINEAKALGAIALFGEKYGDVVRVVNIKDASVELCGGTHIDNTARLGLFRIAYQTSVAAGIRRIEAVTGKEVLKLMDSYKSIAAQTADLFKSNTDDLITKARQVIKDLKDKDKIIADLTNQIAKSGIDKLFENAVTVNSIKVISASFSGTATDTLRAMCDRVRDVAPDCVCVLAGVTNGKVTFAATCGKEAVVKGAHAGNLVKEIAKIAGGSGGGRPDSAMAGATNVTKIDEALAAVESALTAQIVK